MIKTLYESTPILDSNILIITYDRVCIFSGAQTEKKFFCNVQSNHCSFFFKRIHVSFKRICLSTLSFVFLTFSLECFFFSFFFFRTKF